MIKLRLQKVSDANRFFDILNNSNFTFFNVQPKSLEDEISWLKQNSKRKRENTEWNYTITLDNEIVGAIGVKINYHRNHIGEIGYFIDEEYWNKGIASKALKLIEDICFKKLNLTRFEISMQPENTASERIAIKNSYTKEGLLQKLVRGKDGKMKDCYLYAKVL